MKVHPREVSAAASADFLSNHVLTSVDASSSSPMGAPVRCSLLCRLERGGGSPHDYRHCNAFLVEDVGGVDTCRMGYVHPEWLLEAEEGGSGIALYTDMLVV